MGNENVNSSRAQELAGTTIKQIGTASAVVLRFLYDVLSRTSDTLIDNADKQIKCEAKLNAGEFVSSRLPIEELQVFLAGKNPQKHSNRNILAAFLPLFIVCGVLNEVKEMVGKIVNLQGHEYSDVTDEAEGVIEIGEALNNDPDKTQIVSSTRAVVAQKYRNIAIPRFFGFIDEEREIPQVATILSSIDFVQDANPDIYLSLEFVVGALCNEGHILDLDQYSGGNGAVSGFHQMGLDIFSDEYNELVKNGFVPESLAEEFNHSHAVNEAGQHVNSATFTSKEVAIRGFVGTLALRQKYFLDALKRKAINLNQLSESSRTDITQFFTYIYYNAGATIGNRIVANFDSASDLERYFNLSHTNPSLVSLNSAPGNSYVVMAGAEWLRLARAEVE